MNINLKQFILFVFLFGFWSFVARTDETQAAPSQQTVVPINMAQIRANSATERGRVQIDANNNLVADNGVPLRGEAMFITDVTGSTTGNFTLAYLYDASYWLALRDDFNFNAVRLYVSRPPQNWGGGPGADCFPWSSPPYRCYPLDYVLNAPDTVLDVIDDVVDIAANYGMYIIIDYHPVGGHDAADALAWWSQIAPRYQNRTHVLYEAANEPVAWNASAYAAADIQFQEDIYAHIRALAPDTHILLWTFAHCSGPMKAKVDLGTNISYSNASVACHPYEYDPNSVSATQGQYPFFMSEIGGSTVQNEVNLAESLGLSWIGLGVAQTHNVSPNGFLPHEVSWPADPAAVSATAATTMVDFGDVWRFYDQAATTEPPLDGSGNRWFEAAYDDSIWPGSGAAELGYGDGNETTAVSFGGDSLNKHITTYFRHTFNLADASQYRRLWLDIIRDDGAVVYLNGVEVHRSNLPAGTPTFSTLATSAVSGGEETYAFGNSVDPSLLINGNNVLAVEIHQESTSSSDISFDLRLRALLPIESAAAPRNVILMIGDGMGPEHIRAASMFENGTPGTLVMESLPYSNLITTFSANDDVTDSAAAATAMATATKVDNGVISVAVPGDSSELETTLEFFAARCKSTGLVTSTYLTHATPAAFGAHNVSRNNVNDIASDYLTQTRPNVLLGGGGNGLDATAGLAAGYTVVTDRTELNALNFDTESMVLGLFGNGSLPYEYDYETGANTGYDTLPHLSEMINPALSILSQDPDGFFLVVEGGRIDHAGHSNDIERNVRETAEFDRAVAIAYSWAEANPDTMLIVTADHETGGLAVVSNNGAGNAPTVTWSTGGHTNTAVNVFGWGINADLIPNAVDNADIQALTRVGQPALPPPGCASPTALILTEIAAKASQPTLFYWLLAILVIATIGFVRPTRQL